MKTETYGCAFHFIEVYYKDDNGDTRSYVHTSMSVENLYRWYNFYKENMDKRICSCHGWEGVIDDVYIYEGHMCRILSDDGAETLAD